MNTIKNFVKLDYLTIKPYLTAKNFIIYFVLAIVVSYANENAVISQTLVLTFTMLFGTYPFAVGDQNGIDSLYTILGIKREDVVKGRYGFIFTLYIGGSILAMLLYVIITLTLKEPLQIQIALITLASSFLVVSALQFIQFPFFFKNGYLKSKFLAYMPFLGITILALLMSHLQKYQWINFTGIVSFAVNNPWIAGSIVIIVWFIILITSYKISAHYYTNREF